MNVPLNSNFADKFSGWGMNFEGKYDLTPYWSIGAFLNFHTNHRYVDRRTIPLTPTAVSYTHLDVYKRQEKASSLFDKAADETYYKILVPEKNSKGKGVRKGYQMCIRDRPYHPPVVICILCWAYDN